MNVGPVKVELIELVILVQSDQACKRLQLFLDSALVLRFTLLGLPSCAGLAEASA